MKIIADSEIVGAESCFSLYGEVKVYPGREIKAAHLRDADALLVRSVTSIDRELLANTPIRFVGSATIGTDHVDLDYLASNNIHFAHAPGCNASAVVQYVIAALCATVRGWRDKSVSVVGCGQVGGRLLASLKALGLDCRVYDPFLTVEQVPELVSFNEALSADIICLHTPLTLQGAFPTFHMIGERELSEIKTGAILINAGRGAVIDSQALERKLSEGACPQLILDVWEHEPAIGRELLDKVLLGTPHIAGHSVDGKLRGTRMVLDAFEQWLGVRSPRVNGNVPDTLEKTPITVSDRSSLETVVLSAYDPRRDFADLRSAFSDRGVPAGKAFDAVRTAYQLRQEFNHFRIQGELEQGLGEELVTLGFSVDR